MQEPKISSESVVGAGGTYRKWVDSEGIPLVETFFVKIISHVMEIEKKNALKNHGVYHNLQWYLLLLRTKCKDGISWEIYQRRLPKEIFTFW